MTYYTFTQTMIAACAGPQRYALEELAPPKIAAQAVGGVMNALRQGKRFEELAVGGIVAYDNWVDDRVRYGYAGVRVEVLLHDFDRDSLAWVTVATCGDAEMLFVAVELDEGLWWYRWESEEGCAFNEYGMPELACAGLCLLTDMADGCEGAAERDIEPLLEGFGG